jgi:hypothetical protein
MYRLSGRELAEVTSPHTRSVSVEVTTNKGEKLTLADLPPLLDGTINFQSQGIRRRANLTFETMTPNKALLNLLQDDSARYVISLGINGRLRQQGVFFLRDYSIDAPGPNQNFRLYLQDESAIIAERVLTSTYNVQNASLDNIIPAVLDTTGRTLIYELPTFRPNIVLDQFFLNIGTDPWSALTLLLEQYGYEMLMKRTGEVQVRLLPSGSRVCSNIDQLILSEQSTHSRRKTNKIVVLSSQSGGDTIYRGEYRDEDPFSRTYAEGSYGEVTETIEVDGLTSDTDCAEKAAELAATIFGRKISRTWSALQVPNWDLQDPFAVDGEFYVADQISYSMVPFRPMYLTGRERG